MAFARLTLINAYEWIEQLLGAGEPSPTDAQICSRFGFDAPELARALLADLADAGRITIHGFGADRTITLGRSKRQPAAIGRVAPPVARADPVLDRGLAKIAAIVARGRAPAPAPAIEAEPVSEQPPAEKEETIMPTPSPTNTSRVISVPAKGAVLAAIEKRAADDNLPLGQATSAIVADWITAAAERPAVASLDLSQLPTSDLLDEIGQRLTAGSPEMVAAATARADALEGQMSALKTQIGQLLGGVA